MWREHRGYLAVAVYIALDLMLTRPATLAHMALPLLLALGGFVVALRGEPLSFELVGFQLIATAVFLAFPHLLWLGSRAVLRLEGRTWHAGFVLSSIALVFVAVSPVFGRDPSGLPYHWLLYWPLAAAAQVVVAVTALTHRRFR